MYYSKLKMKTKDGTIKPPSLYIFIVLNTDHDMSENRTWTGLRRRVFPALVWTAAAAPFVATDYQCIRTTSLRNG